MFRQKELVQRCKNSRIVHIVGGSVQIKEEMHARIYAES